MWEPTVCLPVRGGGGVLALEPIPSTFRHLARNIMVNGLGGYIEALNVGVGAASGRLCFTADADTVNHVLSEGETQVDVVDVPVHSLDDLLADRRPTIMKIDVEGYESYVLEGAEAVLNRPDLLAIIIELNGSGKRYGVDDVGIHQKLLSKGFETFRYAPFERRLLPLHGGRSASSNTLYVRGANALGERVKGSRSYRIGNGAVL